MPQRRPTCPECDLTLPRDFRGRACPECGARLKKPAGTARAPQGGPRYWLAYGTAALLAGLAVVGVVLVVRAAQGKKELPDQQENQPPAVVADSGGPRPLAPSAPVRVAPKKDATPAKGGAQLPSPPKAPVPIAKAEPPAANDTPAPPAPAPQRDVAAPDPLRGADGIFLEAAVPDLLFLQGTNYGLLRREILRQAVLLAAREEFGLRARDGALGDVAPARLAPAQRFLAASELPTKTPGTLRLEQGDPTGRKLVLSRDVAATFVMPDGLPKFTEAAEALARAEVAATLKKAGLAPRPAPARKAAIPDGVEARLGSLTIPDQFAAARALHAAARAGGDSPALLGALARAYANLGVLTEHLWSVDHKVFKARALLYAERLVKRRPGDPLALLHRAYARALCDQHAAALADLKAAAGLPAAGPAPAWAGLIEPFSKYEDEKLGKLAAADPGVAGLARLLCYLAVEDPQTVGLTTAAADAVLGDNPECTRVLASVTGVGHVGGKHRTTTAYLTVLAGKVPARVAGLPGLPEAVAAKARANAPEPELWAALAAAGEDDREEPSWATLGRLLREDRFVSVWRRVHFMKNAWSVPVEEFVEDVMPLIEGHPYRNAIKLYALDPRRDREAYRKLAFDLPGGDLEIQYHGALLTAEAADPKAFGLVERALRHTDSTAGDYVQLLAGASDAGQAVALARELRAVSPHARAGIVALLALVPTVPDAVVASWEKDEGHQTGVQRALALYYARAGKPAEAERCWRAFLKRSPDMHGYRQLADLLKARGALDQWRETLDEYLKQGEQDLGHAKVRVEIAEHLMGQKKWEEARPYAAAAAETWAGWAMQCATECYTGLGDWEKAELWARRTSERYPSNACDWALWCLRTGRGDLKAARRLAEARVQQLGPRAGIDELTRLVMLYAGAGEHAAALALCERGLQLKRTELIAMLAVAAADAVGDRAKRDRVLGDFTGTSPYAKVAKAFREGLAVGEGRAPDLKAIEAALREGEAWVQEEGAYFVGCFLAARGRAEDARAYLRRCAEGQAGSAEVRALAAVRLRSLGAGPKGVE
jgi:tetratricopeptide (TPR) repeat protein